MAKTDNNDNFDIFDDVIENLGKKEEEKKELRDKGITDLPNELNEPDNLKVDDIMKELNPDEPAKKGSEEESSDTESVSEETDGTNEEKEEEFDDTLVLDDDESGNLFDSDDLIGDIIDDTSSSHEDVEKSKETPTETEITQIIEEGEEPEEEDLVEEIINKELGVKKRVIIKKKENKFVQFFVRNYKLIIKILLVLCIIVATIFSAYKFIYLPLKFNKQSHYLLKLRETADDKIVLKYINKNRIADNVVLKFANMLYRYKKYNSSLFFVKYLEKNQTVLNKEIIDLKLNNYLGLKQYQEAINIVSLHIKNNFYPEHYIKYLIKIYLIKKDYNKLFDLFKNNDIVKGSRESDLLYYRGIIAYDMKRYDEAKSVFKLIMNKYKDDMSPKKYSEVIKKFVMILIDHEQRYISALNFAKKINPEYIPEKGYILASIYYKQKKYQTALKLVDDFIHSVTSEKRDEKKDYLIKAYILKGDIFNKLNKYTKQLNAYETCYQLNSENTEILKRIGNYYYNADNYRYAKEYYKKLINQGYSDKKINYNVARLHYLHGEYSEALTYLLSIIQENESNSYINYLIGTMYIFGKNYSYAKRYLDKAVNLEKDNGRYLNNLAVTEELLNDMKSAARNYFLSDMYLSKELDYKLIDDGKKNKSRLNLTRIYSDIPIEIDRIDDYLIVRFKKNISF